MEPRDFVPAYQLVGSQNCERRAYLLHGALGSGQNLRGLARDLQSRRTDYACVCVDLRGHGASRSAPPPHDLMACALDLVHLDAQLSPSPDAVIGHSLGGKVALAYAQLLEQRGEARLRQVWVLDANPGRQAPSDDVERVVRAVEQAPREFQNRDEAIRSLTDQALSTGLAAWLATNLFRDGSVYRWSLDLQAVAALLADYAAQDYWPYLEQQRARPDIHLVIAERTNQSDPERRKRAEALPSTSRCHAHVLERAGHWLHVDNPTGLRDLILEHL